ncbi:MAG: UDP-N-acetylglucosamine 1-carboxyvinyltransferase [Parcubacteria group bacterium]|nr:UDP-N-acetylglucosamine 1-carboxyvinyltransferase [Parcubacteria group bacterium]
MDEFIIHGGKPLRGTIPIMGMKNAATPLIAASLLSSEPCVLSNIPAISDVARMCELVATLGASVEWLSRTSVRITAKAVVSELGENEAVRKLRSSILLVGPLLARTGHIETSYPGGDAIGSRPLDVHINAFHDLGVRGDGDGKLLSLDARQAPATATVVLDEFSVTATENILMYAAGRDGSTVIYGAAVEPHVLELVKVLNLMGAHVTSPEAHLFVIEGLKKLGGFSHTIIPDQIEIGTFAIAGAVTGGEVSLAPVIPQHLSLVLAKLAKVGVTAEMTTDSMLRISGDPAAYRAVRKIQVLPYPGFPTDLAPVWAVLATEAHGDTLIHDPLYENRFGYVPELVKLGAKAILHDPHRVTFTGPTNLTGGLLTGFDIRAGATLIVAGLAAKGETVIRGVEHIDRGYAKLEERLAAVGADIERRRV